MMTQLGQVSYYPSSGYLRTGAESSVPVDPTLQADTTALATTTTGVPGDSFNPSATTLAPNTAPAEEPQKKKGPNYLAWGALATLAIPVGILLLKKGKVDEAANLAKEGVDNLANGAEAAAKGAAKGAADTVDNVAGNTVAKAPSPFASSTDDASHIADLITQGFDPAKTKVSASSLTKAGQNFTINGEAVQIKNVGDLNKLAKEAASDPRKALELKRGTLIATGQKTKKGALEYTYRPGRIETPEVESIIAKLSAGDEEGAKALAQTNGYRIDGSRIVPSPSKGQTLETGNRTFHVGTEISDVNDITNGVTNGSLRLVGADGKPLTVDLSKLTPDQQKELKFSFQSHLSYEGKPNAATEIVPAVVRVDGFTNPTGWNPFV
jgi:hypothetical protein